jgi:hypothetical protein
MLVLYSYLQVNFTALLLKDTSPDNRLETVVSSAWDYSYSLPGQHEQCQCTLASLRQGDSPDTPRECSTSPQRTYIF